MFNMYLNLVGAVVVGIVLISTIKYWLSKSKVHKNRTREGFELVVHTQKIISYCQQHRGISNAVLNGDKQLKRQLTSIQSQMDKLIGEGVEIGFTKFVQWDSFVEHWPRLKRHSLECTLPSQNLLRQHNMMVDGHMSLLDDVISYYELDWIMVSDSLHLSQLCVDTLKVIESIAQSRGIGAGLCSKGKCEGIDRLSLDFLRISIISPTNELLTELGHVADAELLSQLSISSSLIKEDVDSLLSTIESKLMIDGEINLDAAEFFVVATKPIQELVTVYDNLVAYAVRNT